MSHVIALVVPKKEQLFLMFEEKNVRVQVTETRQGSFQGTLL